MYYTQRWGLDACKRFFGLTDADERMITGAAGQAYLLELWEKDPAGFYDNPLQFLRQEFWHAMVPQYKHPGFWQALPITADVLDYGCGVGAVCQPWILSGGLTTLLEASVPCQEYLEEKYLGENVLVVDESWLVGAEPESVDALVCTDVFEHVLHPLEVQFRLWELLRPGGHALLKFETAYPHAGHLQEAIAWFPAWAQWLRSETEIIELATYAWVRKKG